MPAAEAFALSDSVSSRADIESYHMWRMEEEHKAKDKKTGKATGGEVMKALIPAEADKSKVKNAMASADNFLGFVTGRGFNQYKENVTRRAL